jgi:orotidine-5'-phosphate decarboxylase
MLRGPWAGKNMGIVMATLFADRLLDAIAAKGAPICVGIDPVYEWLPDAIAGDSLKRNANDPEAAIDAIFDYTVKLLNVIAPLVPCVKFQSAYFEKYLSEGVEAYYSLIAEASELGLVVIGDVKRGDIGATSEAYAAAHLSGPAFNAPDEVVLPDAITVNPMLGLDTLAPFLKGAKETSKGLFVLVRTSNPGSAALQDVQLADGRTWSEMLADSLAPLCETEGLVGTSGFSSIGAVVGATQPQTMVSLRKRLPKSIFLLPGYGAQGATAEMTRAAFIDGKGAIISASRSILYAHRDAKYAGKFPNWEKCIEAAVNDMRADVTSIMQK